MATVIGADDQFIYINDDSGSVKSIPISSTAPASVSLTSLTGALNAKDFGAIGDMRTVTDVTVTQNLNQVSSATAKFTQADIGKALLAYNGTSLLFTSSTCPIITAVTSNTTCIVNQVAASSHSNSSVSIGTDNSAAFGAAFTALFALPGGSLVIPSGIYLTLSSWGILIDSTGSLTTHSFSIIGASTGPQSVGITRIVISPYIPYNNSGPVNLAHFFVREYSGMMENLYFTDLGITNNNSFSNVSLFYASSGIIGGSRNCSFIATLPTGCSVLQTTSDFWYSENDTVTATGCGAYLFHGGGYYANLAVQGSDYGIDFEDGGRGTFIGCQVYAAGGPGIRFDGGSGVVRHNVFYNCVINGSGTGTNAAIVTSTPGTAPWNVFMGCLINVTAVLPTSNTSAINNAAGNTLVFQGCEIGAFGSGVGITTAGTVVLSSCYFHTGIPWTASIVYYGPSGGRPSFLLDPNGHIQYVTSPAGQGLSGVTIPAVWSTSGGNTTDNQLTWTDAGLAATLESKTGNGKVVDGGGNLGITIT